MTCSKSYFGEVFGKNTIDVFLGIPGATKKDFSFLLNEGVVNDKQAVLKTMADAGALFVVIKIYDALRVSNAAFNVLSERKRDNRAFDIEAHFIIKPDVVCFVSWVGIGFHIGIEVEKVFIALCAFPKKPPSSKIILKVGAEIPDCSFELFKRFDF